RERLPHAAIGTDVIAGFPGETGEDHAATLAFIGALSFTYLHVFSYSKRPGTKAAALSNHVAGAVIKHRSRELRALSERKSFAFRQSQMGRELRVLTLHPSGDGSNKRTPALSSNFLRIFVDGVFPANRWLDIKLTGCEGAFLTGRVLELDAEPSSWRLA
ncbi:MAG TPA: hypothetical protein VM709_13355, partial [Candidatus Sulfotelmatobacter sp.]|nr:hypothetical protein [Candidatus Sulfotelmatobacter sp.]